jgi:glycosyltransferase involved in cell wall biosynthesis
MENPLVSVLMTAYNREKYVAEAIESVLASSYQHFELIIVDDASKDNTAKIANTYQRINTRVRVYINEQNLGDYGNRNLAASYASGQYIMHVDSDDTILRDGIERCVNVMKQFPDSPFGMRLYNKEVAPYEISSAAVIRHHFFVEPLLGIGPGATIIKRDFFEAINRYPVKYGPANDRYFNLKAACQGSMVFLPFEFLRYRLHEGQEINNQFSYLYNNYLYLRDALNELPLPLMKDEIRWLHLKNKRRFLMNITRYFTSTFNLPKTLTVLKKTQFGFKDMLQAILH